MDYVYFFLFPWTIFSLFSSEPSFEGECWCNHFPIRCTDVTPTTANSDRFPKPDRIPTSPRERLRSPLSLLTSSWLVAFNFKYIFIKAIVYISFYLHLYPFKLRLGYIVTHFSPLGLSVQLPKHWDRECPLALYFFLSNDMYSNFYLGTILNKVFSYRNTET